MITLAFQEKILALHYDFQFYHQNQIVNVSFTLLQDIDSITPKDVRFSKKEVKNKHDGIFIILRAKCIALSIPKLD